MPGCRPFTPGEIPKLRRALAAGRYGKRNVALLTLGITTGFRIGELLSLRRQDVIQDRTIVRELRVVRRNMKGKKQSRTVPLPEKARRALRAWLKVLSRRTWIHEKDFVFQSQSATNAPISVTRAWSIIEGAARSAGLPGHIGTHSLRKTYADRWDKYLSGLPNMSFGEKLRCLQNALGHRSVESTMQYVTFREDNLRVGQKAIWGG